MLLRSLSDCQSLTLKLQVNYPQQHLKGRLGPGVRHVTLFAPKEVGWDPVFVTWCLLPQRRLVGAPCWWRHVFFHQRGSVNHVTFFNQRSSAEPQCRSNVLQKSQNDVAKNTEVLFQISLNSMVQVQFSFCHWRERFCSQLSWCSQPGPSPTGVISTSWTTTTSHLMRFCCLVCEM